MGKWSTWGGPLATLRVAALMVRDSGCRVSAGERTSPPPPPPRFRVKEAGCNNFQKLLPASQGRNLALSVSHVPYSLDSGEG